jgi:hypothetical protein
MPTPDIQNRELTTCATGRHRGSSPSPLQPQPASARRRSRGRASAAVKHVPRRGKNDGRHSQLAAGCRRRRLAPRPDCATAASLAPVAEPDRAPDFESGGQGFESLPAHQISFEIRYTWWYHFPWPCRRNWSPMCRLFRPSRYSDCPSSGPRGVAPNIRTLHSRSAKEASAKSLLTWRLIDSVRRTHLSFASLQERDAT